MYVYINKYVVLQNYKISMVNDKSLLKYYIIYVYIHSINIEDIYSLLFMKNLPT